MALTPTRPPLHQPIVWRPAKAARAPSDAYYHTDAWRALRAAVLKRDHFQCRVKGPRCEGRAGIAHHLIERKHGGADALGNLIACCRACHNALHPEKGSFR